MIFETKKINLETLGEYLAEVRGQLDLSLVEVAEKSGVKQQFIADLEEGNFERLPADVYVLGFLRQLGALYHIDVEMLISQYKRERMIQQQLTRQKAQQHLNKNWFSRVVITPKVLSVTAGVVFVTGTLVYIIWQILSINRAPALEILEPKDRQIIKDSSVSVSGKTEPGMNVTINGENVFVDDRGEFKTKVGVGSGPKQLEFVARNKFGKATGKSVSIVGEAGMVAGDSVFSLQLEFTDTVELHMSVDDQREEVAVYHAGDVKTLQAKTKISISTSNAGATIATLGSQRLGPLGRSGERLDNVPFLAQSAGVSAGQ